MNCVIYISDHTLSVVASLLVRLQPIPIFLILTTVQARAVQYGPLCHLHPRVGRYSGDHPRDAVDEWPAQRGSDPVDVARYADLGHSGSDFGREQSAEFVENFQAGKDEYAVVGKPLDSHDSIGILPWRG